MVSFGLVDRGLRLQIPDILPASSVRPTYVVDYLLPSCKGIECIG